jgi:hypothetical protein
MNRYSLLLVVLALCAASSANSKPQACDISGVTTVEHRDGVASQTITFKELTPADPDLVTPRKEPVTAHIYLPDGDGPFPVILFSHSAIHSAKGTTDLLPLAFALACDGAAVMVLDKTIQWEPYDEIANKDTSVQGCASRWFVTNVNVAKGKIGFAGYYRFASLETRFIGLAGHVGFGWYAPAETLNTEMALTTEGQRKHAAWLIRHLDMRPMPVEWLQVINKPDNPEVATK